MYTFKALGSAVKTGRLSLGRIKGWQPQWCHVMEIRHGTAGGKAQTSPTLNLRRFNSRLSKSPGMHRSSLPLQSELSIRASSHILMLNHTEPFACQTHNG